MLHDDILNYDFNHHLAFMARAKSMKIHGLPDHHFLVQETMAKLLSLLFEEKDQFGKFYFDHNDFDSDENIISTGWDFLENNFMDFPFDDFLFIVKNQYRDVSHPAIIVSCLIDERIKSIFEELKFYTEITMPIINNSERFFIECIYQQDMIAFQAYLSFINRTADISEKVRTLVLYSTDESFINRRKNNASVSAGSLISCCMLLNTKYVDIQHYIPPEKVNLKRAKSKRPLLSDCSIIRIRSEYLEKTAVGTHNSPKPHWRRGHVRKLHDGRMIPVQPCLVNFNGHDIIPSKGVYVHDTQSV